MTFVACIVSTAPLRSEPSHRSEMVSQLLFGEYATVLETTKDFTKIKCLYDGYEGWCQTGQLAETDEEIARWKPISYTINNAAKFSFDGIITDVSIATPVYKMEEYYLGKHTVQYKDGIDKIADKKDLVMFARSYLNTPYLWGGRSSFGIDCSGFTQQVMKLFDIPLHRDSSQQALQGTGIGFLQETKAGDLAFFDNEDGKIIHVGILLEPHKIIHASGRVRIDTIDNEGIINGDTGLRSHRLRTIQRVIG